MLEQEPSPISNTSPVHLHNSHPRLELPFYIIITVLCTYFQNYINDISVPIFAITNAVFWLMNAFGYYILDVYYEKDNVPFNEWGIEKKFNRRERLTFWDMFPISFMNMILNTFLVSMLLIFTERGMLKGQTNLPIVLFELAIYFLAYEIVFYILHRLIHTPYLYRIHKLHHSTYGTVAISCFYMSIIDMLLEIFVSFSCGFVIYNGHYVTLYAWSIISILNTFKDHSGYGPIIHYNHHLCGNINYSVLLMDHIFGTMDVEQS